MHDKGREIVSSRKIAVWLLVLVGIAKLVFIIWQFRWGGFLVAPGGDPLAHIGNIEKILTGNYSGLGYPPLFHFIAAGVVKITGASVISVVKVLAVTLLFLPVPILWWFSRKLFGFWTAFWTTLFYLLASSHPLLGFADGNYPDMLNYGVFIPIFYACLLTALKRNPLKWTLVSLIPLLAMVLTHHFTASLAIIVAISYLLIWGLYLSFNPDKLQRKNLWIVIGIYLLISIPIGLIAKQQFGSILTESIKSASEFTPMFADTTFSTPPSFDGINPLVTPLIEYLGLIGLVLCLISIKKNPRTKVFILTWVIVLWILSRTPLSVLPPRILREINVPLVILAGYAISNLFRQINSRSHKITVSALIGYIIYINLVQISVGPFLLPDGLKDNDWFKTVDQQKLEYLESELPAKSVVLANPANPYLTYFMEHSDSDIQYKILTGIDKFPLKSTPEDRNNIVTKQISAEKANYILLGSTPLANADERTFAEFAGNKTAWEFLNNYKFDKTDVVKEFDDGTKLIHVIPKKLAQ